MAAGKKPVLSSSTALLFTFIYTLSVFCGHRTSCDTLQESSLKSRRAGRIVGNTNRDGLSSTIAADGRDGRIISTHSATGVLFDPPFLDFEEQYVGMPRLETVHVYNPSQTHPLHLNSISGDSPVFHASFFRSKVLKASESTTFDVVFLARVSDEIHTSLYIQTSAGTFDYTVQGVGVPNQYRLRSLLGARIPLNATYSPLIYMFNPFNASLQVTEMYSSGGELHLELLTGQNQGFKSLWEIRPFETKAIGRANYFGRTLTNHTSFIRIKTSHESSPSIVLPVEVEVAASSGLFLSREILDFGVLKSGESKALPLYILNPGAHVVNMEPIKTIPDNTAIEVEFVSAVLKPGSKYAKVATVTFHSDRVENSTQTSGILVIRGLGDVPHKLEVPYESNVLRGSLSYDKSKTIFRAGPASESSGDPVVHRIPLANQFQMPVVIYDVKLPAKAQDYFTVSSFEGAYVLPPGSKWHHPFSVTFTPPAEGCLFNTTLRLATNSTYFTIPIFCYDGRLTYSCEGSEVTEGIDFGVLSNSITASKILTVHNVNPVKFQITSYSVSLGMSHISIKLIAIHPTNAILTSMSTPPPRSPHSIDVAHSASFQINVTSPKSSGELSGEITIKTSLDGVFKVPLFFNKVRGKLKVQPEIVTFKPVFPFGVSEVGLFVENLFQKPVRVESIRREPKDPRFFIRRVEEEEGMDYPELQPNELIQVGTAVFDPLLETANENVYLGVGDRGVWNRSYVSSPQALPGGNAKHSEPVADLRHFSQLWKSWNSLMEDGGNVLNFSYVFTPTSGSEVVVPATAILIWPRVLDVSESNTVEFPTTTIGSSSVWTVNMTNPSYRPLIVQPVLLHHYGRYQVIIDLLAEQLDPDLHNLDFSSPFTNSFAFSLKKKGNVESLLSSVVIKPNASHQISVSFNPKSDSPANTLLLVRNNLTVLDYVLLRGQGVRGVFSINGIQPSSEPLLFEFTQAMMEKCQAGQLVEPMKLNKVLSMHNSGLTPLTLYLVGIGSGGKEEEGFSIVNYKREIIIKPNKTKTIEISYAPDFTISRLSSTLSFKTSSGTELLYPLLAVIPHNLLAICYAMQPRPEWEHTLAWLSVPFWLCAIVVVVALVLVQTKIGSTPPLNYQNDPALPVLQSTGGPVFDLRNMDMGRSRNVATSAASSANTNSINVANGVVPETVSHARSHTRSSSPLSSRPRPSSGGRRDHSPLSTSANKQSSTSFSSSSVPPLSTTSRKEMDRPPSSVTQATSHHRSRAHTSEQKAKELSGLQTGLTTSLRNDSDLASSSKASMRTKSRDFNPPSAPAAGLHSNDEIIEQDNDEESLPSLPRDSGENSAFVQSEIAAMQTDFDKELPSSCAKLKKPSVLDVLDDKVFESSRSHSSESPVLEGIVETVSPTTGVYTAPSHTTKKQQKSSRKTATKSIQRANSQPEATPPPIPQPNHQNLKRDHLVRKESESSVKSADSESTSSSGDKSDDKDLADIPSSQAAASEHDFSKSTIVADGESLESPLESHTQILVPMGKEPNTGQTMPASEDVEIIMSEDVMKKEKVRTKKKQRQLKREEKARKKEKERTILSRAKDRQQSSTEDLGPHDTGVDSGMQMAVENNNSSKRQATAKPEVSKPKSKPFASNFEKNDADCSRKPKDVIELVSAKPGPASLSQPAPSVPSTAIKSSRGSTTKLKDIMLDPFSRNPDRSTYASKKASSRKSQDKSGKSSMEESCLEEDEEPAPEGKNETSDAVRVEEDESEWANADANEHLDSMAGSTVSIVGNDHHQQQQQQNVQTPHDLAASVLSKLPMKIKKVQNSPVKSTHSLDYEEEEGELVTANMAADSGFLNCCEQLEESRPSTISPTKDDSFSSPSPPLPAGQQKPYTLSLDAQPFYPSSNFKASKKQGSKSGHKAKSKATVGNNGRTGSNNNNGEGKSPDQVPHEGRSKKQMPPFSRNLPQDNSTHSTSPAADPAVLEQEYYQHHRADRQSPPSPVYNMSYGPDAHRYDMPEQFYDVPEHPPPHGAFRRIPDRDPRGYYGGGSEEPPFPHSHIDRMPRDMDPYGKGHHPVGPPHSRMPPRNMYPQKMPQHPPVPGYMPPPPGYEGPPPAHAHPSSKEEFKRHQILQRKRQYLVDLYRQERAALAAAYAREQARKSAEALNSLHRPSALPDYALDIGKPPPPGGMHGGGNAWEDYREYEDDSHPRRRPQPLPTSYGIMSDDLELPHVVPSRSRTMSSGSDIGGEILTGYQLGGQSSSSVGAPGYKRAPGAEYNSGSARLEQSQSVRGMEDNGENYDKVSATAWSPTEAEDPESDWGSKWPSSSINDNNTQELFPPLSSNPSFSGLDLSSESGPQYIGSTYELFENQSIWSLNNSGSETSNLLSWALKGAEQDKNSSDQ